MKKIIIFLFILTIILNQSIVLAQNTTPQVSLKDYVIPQCGTGNYIENKTSQPIDEEAIKECAKNFNLDFNNLRSCVGSSGINTGCISRNFPTIVNNLNQVIECLENAVPDYGYLPLPMPGVGKGNFNFNFKTFIEMVKNQLIMEGMSKIASIVGNFLGNLLGGLGGLFGGGSVPTDDKGSQGLIGKSIEETAKNFVTQLETGIKLGLSDSQDYFKFKLKSTLENLVYNKISKNFIPDIQQYRYLRMSQAYTRAVDKLLKPYTQDENIQCLPFEVKACAYNLLKELNAKASAFMDKSKDPKAAKKIFRSITKTNRFSILNKPNCDPNDPNTFHIYTALGLSPSVIVQKSSATLTAYIKPTNQILARAENNEKNLALKLGNFFANPFKIINLRNLLGQTRNNLDQNKLIDQEQIINQAIEIANCNLIFNTSTAKIFQELDEELSTFNAYSNEPGGTTFMPKTACLKTDAEAKLETLQAQLEEEQKKSNPDNNKIASLQNTINEYKKIADQQRKSGITGESSFCIKKDEIKNPIATYEDLREKISKNTFDFLNQSSSGNVIATFIRGWINSSLFNLIDKGFADFNKGENQELFIQNNLDKIYSQQQKDCDKLNNSGVTGLKEVCQNVVFDNRALGLGMNTFNVQNKLIEIKQIIELIPNLQNKNSAYYATITDAITTITTNYIAFLNNPGLFLGQLNNYSNGLENISSRLNELSSNTQQHLNLASTTLNQLITTLNNLNNSTITKEIDRLNQEINKLSSDIEQTKKQIQEKIDQILRDVNNPKISNLFLNANVNDIHPDPRYYYHEPIFNIPFSNSEYGSNIKILSLGSSIRLSFYDHFYPELVNAIAGLNNIGSFFNTNLASIIITEDVFGSKRTSINIERHPDFVIADMSAKIFAILYSIPQSAAVSENQQNLLTAVTSQLNNFLNGTATMTKPDIDRLNTFFTNLEEIASRTLKFINNTSDPKLSDLNHSFTLQGPNNYSIQLNTREVFRLLLRISSNFKDLFNFINKNNIINTQNQINQLNTQLTKLKQQHDNEMDKIFQQSGIDQNQINNVYQEIQKIIEELNNIDTELSSLCEDYNNSIIELEASINAQIRNQSSGSSGPPLEEDGGDGGSANNFGKFLALIVKNLTGNIFETINFIKPKKIEIK
ncbi:MAG: hypothetical protein KatS3mg094_329 [Candidatus Parcubacteria bacterium]|nr:MAG: hypothetical protein KatS3mg094_329 [Candidatus Parcubacteria bacterium]